MSKHLKLCDFSVRFGHEEVFRCVNLQLDLPNGVVAILGRNGVGKSTLLRVLATCIKPTAGDATIEADGASQQYIGQRPVILSYLSPKDNAYFFSRISRWRKRFDEDALLDTANALDGSGILAQDALSGGEMRLIEFLRAIAVRPRILLLDEPFGSWDLDRRRRVYQVLEAYCRQSESTALVATHLPLEVLPTCDMALLLLGPRPVTEIRVLGAHECHDGPEEVRLRLLTGHPIESSTAAGEPS